MFYVRVATQICHIIVAPKRTVTFLKDTIVNVIYKPFNGLLYTNSQ